jgi:hypothetical protein
MKTCENSQKVMAITLGFLLLVGFSAIGQIRVISNGNTGIGTTNPLSKLSVNSDGDTLSSVTILNSSINNGAIGLKVLTSTDTPGSSYNTYTNVYAPIASGDGYAQGIFGRSYNYSGPQTTGRSYGIYGMAGNATSGFNYGVCGILQGGNNGAGIFGATDPNDEDTEGMYAGYFKGDVYMSSRLSVGNKNTTYSIDVTGSVRTTSLLQSSDIRIKENIKDLENSLSALKKLQGVSYNLKMPENSAPSVKGDTINRNTAIIDSSIYTRVRKGLIAQELQKVFPELVYEDEGGILSVDYIGLIPVVVEALKEQDNVIGSLNLKIQELQSDFETFSSIQQGIAMSTGTGQAVTNAVLYQNAPNPFSESTEIQYYIPEATKSATLYIFNMQGTLLRSEMPSTYGDGTITLKAAELKAGMYIYTLIVDGKEVGSRRMILTD